MLKWNTQQDIDLLENGMTFIIYLPSTLLYPIVVDGFL